MTMSIRVSTSLTIGASQVLSFRGDGSNDGLYLVGDSEHVDGPTWTNNGDLTLYSDTTSAPNGTFLTANHQFRWNPGAIINNGRVTVTADNTQATGFYRGGVAIPFTNTGNVAVTGLENVYGVKNWTGDFNNTGQINVTATRGSAYGAELSMLHGTNGGLIDVTARGSGAATGVVLTRNTNGVFTNTGTISAHQASGDATAILLDRSGVGQVIDNSGTLSGDYAVRTANDSYFLDGLRVDDVLRNSGRIIGRVSLGADTDKVYNSGTIQGDVDLGDQNDLYDGRGGSVSGMVTGGGGADSLLGGDVHDYLHGNAGNDTEAGGAGADWVVGGQGEDLLQGEAGDDVVYGNLGNDSVLGGDGVDWVRGGQGDDSVAGGAGDDHIWGDRGNDTISGGGGADTFHVFAGVGVDRVFDFNIAEGDRVVIDDGASYTVAQSGSDTVVTLAGGDTLVLVGISLSNLPSGWILGA